MPEIKKVLIVTNIPNPYRIPLFNELNKKLSETNIQLKIAFGAPTYSRRKFQLNPEDFKFNYTILASKTFHFGNNEKTFFTYKGLLKIVKEFHPDKIIIIGFSIGTVKLWLRSFFKKTPYIIWSGSILNSGRYNSLFRKIERKMLMSRASGFIAYGNKAKQYLVANGVDANKVAVGINTVDTSFFVEETRKLRSKLSHDRKKHLLYLGYLTPGKQVIKLLETIQMLTEIRTDFILDIVGDGSEKLNLEKFIDENLLEQYVIFHGFKEKGEIPDFFAKTTCLLFPTSDDVWGLVLNEAMASGVPCLSTDKAGATNDLVIENETGFVVDFDHKEEVINKINFLLDNPEKAKLMGEKAADLIKQKASISKSAEGFVYAIMNF
jgi:glycosyltransferase involved in cell wall biosynthesis